MKHANIADGELLLVSFGYENESTNFVLNVQKVMAVMELEKFVPLPPGYFPFVAVGAHERGPIPILDLYPLMKRMERKLEEKDPEAVLKELKESRIVVCHVQDLLFGIRVDWTRRITRAKNSELVPLPQALSGSEPQCFSGMIRQKDGMYSYLLDIESILIGSGIRLGQVNQGTAGNELMKGKRVLVVEDSKLFRKMIGEIFERAGATCEYAEDGKAGLQVLRERNYGFDLVFTDIEMPLMNGIQMAKVIKEECKIPIIFNSSLSNPTLIEEIRSEGLGDYLVKIDESKMIEKAVSATRSSEVPSNEGHSAA